MLLALAVLVVAACVAYRNVGNLDDTSGWVSHTREVIGASQSLLESVVRVESSERGFLLTDEPEHLQSYHLAAAQIENEIQSLAALTEDNPAQLARVTALQTDVNKKRQLMDQLVKLPAESRKESFKRDRLLTVGTQQMQNIRSGLNEIRSVENRLLDERMTANRSARSNALFMSLLTTGIAVSFLLTSFMLMRRAERMRLETERLARYNQRLLESTGEGIYGIDTTGHCTFMNRAGSLILGGRPEQFLGREMHELVHHTQTDGSPFATGDCPISRALQTAEGCRVDDDIFWRLDGKSVPVAYSTFPLRTGNIAEGAVITFTDIAGRKRAELDLIDAKVAAEQANEAKSQFLANMSHELRTPLNAVIMYSELLQEESEDRELDEFIPDLKRIRQAGKHLLELVNSLLDLSKIEAGKMELYLETFDVELLIREVASTVEPLVEKRNNTLLIETVGLSTMHNDVTKIRQVLFNLLSNACKFTENGTIRLKVSQDASLGQVRFEVSDTGIGMSAEQTARLFQPFMQADASTTRKFGGTGLGLAIIKRFTDLMGGEVTVSSEAGVGTTFVVTLPNMIVASELSADVEVVDEKDSQRNENQSSLNSAIKKQTNKIAEHISSNSFANENNGKRVVLVIDDDPTVRDVMMRVLLSEGMRPITASDGMEGVQIAKQIHPDLIVLDVLMPRVDG